MTDDNFNIREFSEPDFSAVKEIYQQGIDTKNATFENLAPDWADWDKKFLARARFVAEIDGKVAGWAALSATSARPVYSGVCEVTVYVDQDFRGKGVGKALLGRLIEYSEQNNIWTLQAGIFPENGASISIHQLYGFREVGRRVRIGKMGDEWRDTVLLERRSLVVGN